ncbi:MAG: HlyD family efflux transporter periplasmic adaptor subunit [Rhodospirillaceae bacterium]|jgi:HlyD family secretion protein|nr:HlyD family efflux transporter periplasmic adaptor subunit [Rhodospirillaceae bacterium]MBT7954525.1 HlyD family efflux transporter periplasmic adaptor subunit [Rhodospirillaceae bacterium]
MRKSPIFFSLGFVGLLAVGAYFWNGQESTEIDYRLAKVERGNIIKSVSASGELNAVVTVEVGSEISGQISALTVDFNSDVKAGQIIARIDPESFEARVKQAEAELSVAKASVATKQAAIAQAKANQANASSVLAAAGADVARTKFNAADLKQDFGRKQALRKKGVVAISAVDKARAAWQVAAAQVKASQSQLLAQRSTVEARKAQVQMAKAEVLHASAQVEQKDAALNIAKVNLNNTFIRSPVDGVVIGRDVDVGQTVAASLQAPILFTIAQDLRKMQVETNIDEADIGQIRPGQTATFGVDSFPGQEFKGIVNQVRKKPQTVQNVVTYTVVIAANNADLKLLPGMTANVQVQVSDRRNVLRLPNRSLRFVPPGLTPKPQAARSPGGFGGPPGGAARGGPPNREARQKAAQARIKRLVEKVGLTEDQQQQVRDFGRQMIQRIRTMAQGGRGPGFRDAIRKLRQENGKRILTILTPEQKVKYRLMIAERRSNPATPGRVWVLEDGKPKQIDVMIGVGDGTVTEVVRGDLKEGQQVILGIKRPETSG